MDFNALQRDLMDAANTTSHQGSHSSSATQGNSIYDYYEFLDELGHGAYGSVMKAKKKANVNRSHRNGGRNSRAGSTAVEAPAASTTSNHSSTFYAVKIIDKKKAGSKGLSEVMGEVETMSLLNHPNIVHLEETFQDEQMLWIVMEYVPGGELHKVLKEKGFFSESVARRIIIQLLFAVEYIHQRGVVHRDLKPANMLIRDEQDYQIKIADFGFAVLVGSDSFLTSYCGTGAYMAPEIVQDSNYGKPVDIWACGVILYLLISGDYPFQNGPSGDITDAIIQNKWQQNMHPRIQEASPGARDFIAKLLTSDPAKRLTAKEALKQTWIQSAMQGLSSRLDAGHQVAPLTRLKSWVHVIVAAHRLVYWRKLTALRSNDCDFHVLKNYTYLVTGRYEPPRGVLNVSGVFQTNPKAVLLLLAMVEASQTIDSLDLSNNNIDSLDYVQSIVRSLTNHPSLTTLSLERNPIPTLAGRGLVRLARATTNRIKALKITGTQISADVSQQIATALKEKRVEGVSEVGQSSSSSLSSTSRFSIPSTTMSPLPPNGTANQHRQQYQLFTSSNNNSGVSTPNQPTPPSSSRPGVGGQSISATSGGNAQQATQQSRQSNRAPLVQDRSVVTSGGRTGAVPTSAAVNKPKVVTPTASKLPPIPIPSTANNTTLATKKR